MWNIRNYYKGKMSTEMQWLSILYATFGVSYGLRMGYQYGLGSFHKIVPEMVVRWHVVNTVPLLWDITSIGAILIMHHMNFRPRKNPDAIYSEDIYDLYPEDVEDISSDRTLPRFQGHSGSTLQSDDRSSFNSE